MQVPGEQELGPNILGVPGLVFFWGESLDLAGLQSQGTDAPWETVEHHGSQEPLMEPRLQCVTQGPQGSQESIVRLWNNMALRFHYDLPEPQGSKEPL